MVSEKNKMKNKKKASQKRREEVASFLCRDENSRMLSDTAVQRGTDLQTAEELYNFLKDQPSSIKYFWISEEDIVKYDESVPTNVPAVKGTLKIHQVTSEEPALIQWREISCFCARPLICKCYEPSPADFRNLSENLPSTNCQQDLKGKFIMVRYESKPFVGQVIQVVGEEVEVSCMQQLDLLLMIRSDEDRQQAKTSRMNEHIGKTKQRVQCQFHGACVFEPEEKQECSISAIEDLGKQEAGLQSQFTTFMSQKKTRDVSSKGATRKTLSKMPKPNNPDRGMQRQTKKQTFKP
ncbi:hypothetical protein PAMA_017008 [Pampus argenteus]